MDADKMDKFDAFKLIALLVHKVKAPLIKECHGNFECNLVNESLIRKYSLFISKVVKAYVACSAKNPKTIHYQDDGQFMVADAQLNPRRHFKPEML